MAAALLLVAPAGHPAMAEPAVPATAGIIPAPASVKMSGKDFVLTESATIGVPDERGRGPEIRPVADLLAGLLRPSTGFDLPVVSRRGTITLALNGPARLGEEGYLLRAGAGGVRLHASKPAGLFHAVQTLRQLLPARVESRNEQPGPWRIRGVKIEDKPRFAWRGAMLDVSRHFLKKEEVKRYIDLAAMYKINRLHLHLSDDQGWRVEIKSWPRLATYGGSTQVGGGPGGYYTQDDYKEIIAYAAKRHMMVIPEIDMPGHTNAALASYAELNCDGVAPPLYTGTAVGFSSLCIDKEITYEFVDDVVGEIAEMTPGPYFHIGGDEAHVTSKPDYRRFIERIRKIVAKHDKTLVGWHEIGEADKLNAGSVGQFWNFTEPSPGEAEKAVSIVRQGGTLVMSPANKVYLDMKYNEDTPYGLTWAGLVEVDDSYAWEPADILAGIGDREIQGVEAPLWSETISNVSQAEFMAYPRLPGLAEKGWSARGQTWDEYKNRLAAQGPRWEHLNVNFYRSPKVPWPAGVTE